MEDSKEAIFKWLNTVNFSKWDTVSQIKRLTVYKHQAGWVKIKIKPHLTLSYWTLRTSAVQRQILEKQQNKSKLPANKKY